jgi:SAM-dependent methyltransferase
LIEDATLDLLVSLAGSPPRALELAVGTGRIAIPLSQRGVKVTGIEISDEMITRMRAKPGGEAIEVAVGDMADVDVEGVFPVVLLAFNTIFALLTQERQVECFQNVADHLEPGGRFVLDCFVPDMKRFDDHNTRMGVSSISSSEEHAIEMSIHSPLKQRITSHMVRREADGQSLVLPVVTPGLQSSTSWHVWPASSSRTGGAGMTNVPSQRRQVSTCRSIASCPRDSLRTLCGQ